MEQIIYEVKEQLLMKGYSKQTEPVQDEKDHSTVFTASGDGKTVYVKLLDEKEALTPQVESAAMFEAQMHDPLPDFIWVSDGGRNYYGDCLMDSPLSEVPAAVNVATKEKKKLSPLEQWSREQYESLQKRFDELHERLYGPSGKDNISGTNEAIDELSKLIFMEIFRLYHPDYVLNTGECTGLKLYDILDYHYIQENEKEAVKQIRTAFKEVKNHEDYIAINDLGEKCSIFSEDEYIKLENPANYVATFKVFQDLGEFIDEDGNAQVATLKHISADILGRIFDVLMRGKYDNKMGQATYLTPRPVTEAMVDMVMHDLTSNSKNSQKIIAVDDNHVPTFRVLDPTCGSGGFLIKAYEAIKKYIMSEFTGQMKETMLDRLEAMKEHSFVGADSSRNMILKARLNMAMHGLPKAPIFWVDNSLTSISLKSESYDLILTNPPFASGSVKKKDKEGKAILDFFTTGIDEHGKPKKEGLCLGGKPNAKGQWNQVSSTDQAVLFIDRDLQLLKPGGYLVVILPDGILSNSSYKHVREYLMGQKNEVTGEFEGGKAILKAVVSLPTVTFQLSGTGAKTSFLYIKKKEHENEKQGPIFMAVADEIGFDVKSKVEIALGNDRNDLLKIVELYKQEASHNG
ncbi:HsdM family class I SAM-dependent methyltransferase [Priestia megaterium]